MATTGYMTVCKYMVLILIISLNGAIEILLLDY